MSAGNTPAKTGRGFALVLAVATFMVIGGVIGAFADSIVRIINSDLRHGWMAYYVLPFFAAYVAAFVGVHAGAGAVLKLFPKVDFQAIALAYTWVGGAFAVISLALMALGLTTGNAPHIEDMAGTTRLVCAIIFTRRIALKR